MVRGQLSGLGMFGVAASLPQQLVAYLLWLSLVWLTSNDRSVVDRTSRIPEAMKGVILAGGTGSRLYPLTRITNKHLLPIYDRPMISYAIEALVKSGVSDMMLVTGGNDAGEFLPLLGDGSQFSLKHIDYTF